MIWHSAVLRKDRPQAVAEMRRQRLKKFIDLKAPEILVIAAAELYLRTYRLSWRGMWQDFKAHKFPRWLLWLTDADYRAVCRGPDEIDDFERDMREMLAPRAKDN